MLLPTSAAPLRQHPLVLAPLRSHGAARPHRPMERSRLGRPGGARLAPSPDLEQHGCEASDQSLLEPVLPPPAADTTTHACSPNQYVQDKTTCSCAAYPCAWPAEATRSAGSHCARPHQCGHCGTKGWHRRIVPLHYFLASVRCRRLEEDGGALWRRSGFFRPGIAQAVLPRRAVAGRTASWARVTTMPRARLKPAAGRCGRESAALQAVAGLEAT